MIIVDTNVISEMMKSSPSENVIAWIDQQETMTLYITSISIAEIDYGLSALPVGSRRRALEDAFCKTMTKAFEHRVLPFDEPAAYIYGKTMSHRKQLGKPMSILDGQIAAIARDKHATIATRNVRDFAHCEVELVNPFS